MTWHLDVVPEHGERRLPAAGEAMTDSIAIDDAELVRRLRQSNDSLRQELANTRAALAWDDKQKHHDVLCLVLKAHLESKGDDALTLKGVVSIAREIANLAYPPPKSTTDELRAAGFVPHGRDPLTGAPLPPKAEDK